MSAETVLLPSGITVLRRGLWLHQSCPLAREHSPFPRDFNAGSGLSRTHRQAIHPACGLWALWIKKPQDAPVPEP